LEETMPGLSDIIEGEAQQLATGFTFTEGPLYHPDGFYYFVDVRQSKFYRIKPGGPAELLRENTGDGNGTTFDPQGRLILCEGANRRVTRWPADGKFASHEVLMDKFEGKRLSRPNDVVCKSDGSIYLTNPGLRIPVGERELDPSAIYRVKPDGSTSHVADFEYPNGLAFSARRLHPPHRDRQRRQHGPARHLCRHVLRREDWGAGRDEGRRAR
jgi:gluconolactonase